MTVNPTAALIIIGNEILSGRTLDLNTQHIAKTLNMIGVELLEVRVVPDVEDEIIEAVNTLRKKFRYVFTTGGIGPTHDDITPESIAKAFGRKLELDNEAHQALIKYYGGAEHLNEGRLKMCYLPENAGKIANSVTAAPGFYVENVFVLAGVPKIMHAMLDAIIPLLDKGIEVTSKSVRVDSPESAIAAIMKTTQKNHDGVQIGSYPYLAGDNGYAQAGVNIVFRSTNVTKIDTAITEIILQLKAANIVFEI